MKILLLSFILMYIDTHPYMLYQHYKNSIIKFVLTYLFCLSTFSFEYFILNYLLFYFVLHFDDNLLLKAPHTHTHTFIFRIANLLLWFSISFISITARIFETMHIISIVRNYVLVIIR